ncbi:MAG: hypothetical protein KH355_13090 [Clostridiales bacterium]|nr:hypothetical protein [Clostridiales bacterium]
MKKVVSYLLVGSMILSSFSATYSVIVFAGQAKKNRDRSERWILEIPH